MCPGTSEVPVDDNNGDQDTHGVHDEGKQQILHQQKSFNNGNLESLYWIVISYLFKYFFSKVHSLEEEQFLQFVDIEKYVSHK